MHQKYIPINDERTFMSISTTSKNSQFSKYYLIERDKINLNFSVCFDTFA